MKFGRNYIFVFLMVLLSFSGFGQIEKTPFRKGKEFGGERGEGLQMSVPVRTNDTVKRTFSAQEVLLDTVPKIEQYLKRNDYFGEVAVDTSLTVKSHYEMNYLNKDLFARQTFSNDGSPYNRLEVEAPSAVPMMGFAAQQQHFLQERDVFFYEVPTAYSRLSFRTAVKQGQNLDAFFSSNINRNLNVFVGYRGLRSLGLYINDLRSIGNLQVGGSYLSSKKNYAFRAYYLNQDVTAKENGGITELDVYRDNDQNRDRLDVRLRDAESFLNQNKFFVENEYKLLKGSLGSIAFSHQLKYEANEQVYKQSSVISQNLGRSYFGDYFSSSTNDSLWSRRLSNEVRAAFEVSKIGKLSAGVYHQTNEHWYKSVVVESDGGVIPAKIAPTYTQFVSGYQNKLGGFDVNVQMGIGFLGERNNFLTADVAYAYSEDWKLRLGYQLLDRLPNFTARFFQSNFVKYNWNNDFNTIKTQRVDAELNTPFFDAHAWVQQDYDKVVFRDHSQLFDGFGQPTELLVSPVQFNGNVVHYGLELAQDFSWKKWNLDARVAYQQVVLGQEMLNLPTINTRTTLYYSDYMFQRALFFQAGISTRYFTAYYADGYHPVLSDFYVQNHTKIGGFPMVDAFVNMKIKTARIYVAAEQLNQLVGKSNHFSAPGIPFRDMTLRLGIIWSFFN